MQTVDLEMLAAALEDQSGWDAAWMFDPNTGETTLYQAGWEDQEESDKDSPSADGRRSRYRRGATGAGHPLRRAQWRPGPVGD
ncbi:hypothetical protein, partial [Arthrobacter sp. H5]|uniref:hypothetical protein n=1 Tax=Arthrobacter sp. H5 TaxID=1267973 RepID=UPI000562E3DD